ncbi:MAG: M1 family metallopeptidase [Dermatophilaceae bacterium]
MGNGRDRRRSAPPPTVVPPRPADADPYLPGHGDVTFAVRHYDLALDYRLTTNALRAVATLTVDALEPIDTLTLDLHGLTVRKVRVDGALARHRHTGSRLLVRLPEPLAPGVGATVRVSYAGRPVPVEGPHGEAGWEELADGALVASQPYGSPSWFPCNDRVSDKATYRVAVTTESDYTVVVTGQGSKPRREAGRRRWTFEQTRPTPTYLMAAHVGRYTTTAIPGPVPLRVHHPGDQGPRARRAFGRLPIMLDAFVDLFGPYPFAGYEVVVTPEPLEIPLEAQGLATFGVNFLEPGWEQERLIAHELAHQWFGNCVTVGQWQDVWLHEGFACYAEWLWAQASGHRRTDALAAEHWARLDRLPQDLVLANPGPEAMFDDRVYKRGALALHALRKHLGDPAFFAMLRDWVARYRFGTVSTADFLAHARRHAPEADGSLGRLLDVWLFSPALPALAALPGR